jgi:cellulose biosynthesis protein BcsQ
MSTMASNGRVITFYSYKGGTGRSMALANVACLLAQRSAGGGGVLMMDWDLEAPGLHRFFQDRFAKQFGLGGGRERDLDLHPGLIDLFGELETAIAHEFAEGEGSDPRALGRLLDLVDLDRFVLATDIDSLYLVKAGRFDEHYSTNVNTFDWEGLYNRAPELIPFLAKRLSERFDYVLIDSRTGLTDISGICTMLLPEKLVTVFTPNRQSLTGVLELMERATNYRKQSLDLRPLVVYPLPSRIELAEPERRETWRSGDAARGIRGYQELFEQKFRETYSFPACDLGRYFDEVQIQHQSRYAYGEEVAVLVEPRGDSLSLTRRYRTFVQRSSRPVGHGTTPTSVRS